MYSDLNNEIQISSLQNQLVKDVLNLQSKSRARREQNQFVCEGLNEIKLCKTGGYKIGKVLFCKELISVEDISVQTGIKMSDVDWVSVSRQVFSKISYREDVANAIAIVKMENKLLSDFQVDSNPLFLIAERVEKPGNLGALLRSADAARISAVILADPLCDIYNPNVIRSSVGCVFTVPVYSAKSTEIQQYLSEKNIQVFTTYMENAVSAWQCSFAGPSAIVVGTENSGLTDIWKNENYKNINFPMFGAVDSLNVSVAASLLMFEAVRQRSV